MPLPLHQVVPVRLSDSRIPAAAENKLETVTNTTLCQVGTLALTLDTWHGEVSTEAPVRARSEG